MRVIYNYPIALTQQFRFCGNPFRVDTYKGCDFGCTYCFANARGGGIKHDFDIANIDVIYKLFEKAFESDREYKNINVELLKNRVPLHLGGMSDPFQSREFETKNTYKLLELSNKYQYPIIISTKQANLPKEYWNILNPKLHAFQISLIGFDEDFIRKYETNTPTVKERIEFIKKLHNEGFWVSLRLQPLIDINQAILLIEEIDTYINYITVEHIKVATDNKTVYNAFLDLINQGIFIKPKRSRNFEMSKDVKIDNINKIKNITKVPIGCGDNDLHYMSDSRCCCGIDTINDNFNNYLKYNTTYFDTGGSQDDIKFYPTCIVSSCINQECGRKPNLKTVKDYVDDYIR